MRTVWILAGCVGLLRAQPTPKFEVVSVKPCRPDATRQRSSNKPPSGPAEILTINCQTVERMIEDAYDAYATGRLRFRANPVPLEGAPDWVRTERFTIQAKAESPQSRVTMHGPMLQRLLEDRFQLKLRREPKEVPVYVLTVAKGGPKNLEPAKAGACLTWDLDHMPTIRPGGEDTPCGLIGRRIDGGVGHVEIRGASMATMAEQLSILMDRDVIDKTGLAGTFDFHVEVPADELSADSSAAPRDDAPKRAVDESALAFAAVRRLGLKLEAAKGLGEVFVIERVERPTEN